MPVVLLGQLLGCTRWGLVEVLAWHASTPEGREYQLDWTTDWVRAAPPARTLLAALRHSALRECGLHARFREWLRRLPEGAQMRAPPDGLTFWPLQALTADPVLRVVVERAEAEADAEERTRW